MRKIWRARSERERGEKKEEGRGKREEDGKHTGAIYDEDEDRLAEEVLGEEPCEAAKVVNALKLYAGGFAVKL